MTAGPLRAPGKRNVQLKPPNKLGLIHSNLAQILEQAADNHRFRVDHASRSPSHQTAEIQYKDSFVRVKLTAVQRGRAHLGGLLLLTNAQSACRVLEAVIVRDRGWPPALWSVRCDLKIVATAKRARSQLIPYNQFHCITSSAEKWRNPSPANKSSCDSPRFDNPDRGEGRKRRMLTDNFWASFRAICSSVAPRGQEGKPGPGWRGRLEISATRYFGLSTCSHGAWVRIDVRSAVQPRCAVPQGTQFGADDQCRQICQANL